MRKLHIKNNYLEVHKNQVKEKKQKTTTNTYKDLKQLIQ